MGSVRFNCGEFKPGQGTISTPGSRPPITPILVARPRQTIPHIPFIPGGEEWVCICEDPCTSIPGRENICSNPASRRCVRTQAVPPGVLVTQGVTYASRAECERAGFDREPCLICGIECVELERRPCPPPFEQLEFIDRQCFECPPARVQPPNCRFQDFVTCDAVCVDQGCPRAEPRPRSPITPGGGPGPSTGGPGRPRPATPAPITPTTFWRCKETPIYCPQDLNLPVPQRRIYKFQRTCESCGSFTNLANVPPDCRYRRLNDCQAVCMDSPPLLNCGPITGVRPAPPAPPGPRGAVPQPTPTAPVRGPTTGGTGRWICNQQTGNCAECTPVMVQIGLPCDYTSLEACRNDCDRRGSINFGITPTAPVFEQIITPGGGSSGGGEGIDQSQGGPESLNRAGRSLNANKELRDTLSQEGSSSQRKVRRISILESAREAEVAASGSFDSSQQNTIYNPKFNFFKTPPVETTQFVENQNYRNIFQKTVAHEVAYVLERVDGSGVWDEHDLVHLTLDKIAASILPSLLNAFDNIHYLGGLKVDKNDFLEGLRKHILMGTLSEFDPDYYIRLAALHSDDEFLEFDAESSLEIYLERAALGILANESLNSDPDTHEDIHQAQQLKRQRRLYSDIEAAVEVCKFDESILGLYLGDGGIASVVDDGTGAPEVSSLTNSYIDLGEGGGYYFSAQLENATVSEQGFLDQDVPLPVSSQLSATLYVPPDVRFNALTLIGKRPSLKLSVSSPAGSGEFASNFDPSANVEPMYFYLELSTVRDLERENPLVDTIKGTYKRITDPGEINRHSITFGWAVSKVNIDYRDPFIHYARDSSSIDFEQLDITFRSFKQNKQAVGQNIVSRNVPFGLIVAPGIGSTHNPFNAASHLDEFEGTTVGRSIELIPDPSIGAGNTQFNVALSELPMFHAIGTNHFGLKEKDNPYSQNIVYLFETSGPAYDRSYYTSAGYASSQPPTGDRRQFITTKLVRDVVDYLIDTYDPDDLTWFDVYSRLSMSEMGEVFYHTSKRFIETIGKGWRGDPIVPVRWVLADANASYTGITSTLVDGDDVVIPPAHRTGGVPLGSYSSHQAPLAPPETDAPTVIP